MSALQTLPADRPVNSLVITPHPMHLQGQRIYHDAMVLPGEYLDMFLARYDVKAGQQWAVAIGGREVPEIYWCRLKPYPGYLIEVRRVPADGILKLAATAALAYFTFGAGGIAGGGFFGLTGAAGWLAAGVAYLGGSLVINKLLGPKQTAAPASSGLATTTNSPSYTLQAAKNRARQFEPMGLMLGQPYCIPDLGAQPYTFFANGEQYLWQLFHFGLNCASAENIRIGQTPIENYAGVTLLRDGFDSGNTGLPVLTTNVDSVPGGLLEASGGPGPYVTRTSSTNTIVLEVDYEAQLYDINPTDGAIRTNTMEMTIEYRAVGGGGWLPFPLDNVALVRSSWASTKPLRVTYQRTVPAGQYEVRMQKVTPDLSTSAGQNSCSWQTLKSYQQDTGDYAGEARMAIQVQASGQLNGALDEVNAVGTAKPMPYWNGAAWVTATNRDNGLSNPGALMLLLYRGIYDDDGNLLAGMGLPDDEIDIEGLKGFMVHCALHGFRFDLFLQENISIGDLVETIAAAGLGSRSEHTGKMGVIWFTDDQPIEGVLNMGTMKPKSFSVDYITQETADEIEFQYFDRARNHTWKSVRVKAPGTGTPQRTARQQLMGVTEEAHAAIVARFGMAQNIFQRKTINNEVDLEHLTFRRGTVMALSHDLTQWGYGGRLKAAAMGGGSILTFTLDDVIPAVSPTGAVTRYIGLRIPGETQYRIFPLQAFAGTTRTVTLAVPWPGGVLVPGGDASNPAHDTVWIYDFKPTPGIKLRVSDVAPKGNLDGATVQLVPESAEFWDYVWNGSYTPPPNNSLLNRNTPVVTRALVTEQLERQGIAYFVELTLTMDVTGNFDRAELWGATGASSLQRIAETRTQTFTWRGGLQDAWTLEVRPYSATRAGTRYQLTYAVLGLSVVPHMPIGVAATQEKVFCTPDPRDHDIDGFLVRSTPGVVRATPADFLRGTAAHQGYVSGFPWDFMSRLYGVQTVMVVTVDTSGNWSEPGYYTLDFGQPSSDNIGQVVDYRALGWPGEHTGSSIVGGDLLADADPVSDINLLDDFNGEPDLNVTLLQPLVYYARTFVPLYGGGTLVLDIETEGPQPTVEYRSAGSNANDLNAEVDLNADTNLNGDSGGWLPWPGALQLAKDVAYELRITISGGTEQPALRKLIANLVLQKAEQNFSVRNIEAAGTRLDPVAGVPPLTWVRILDVSMLPEVDGSGAVSGRFIDLSPTLGPLVQQVNSAGVPVLSRSLTKVGGLIDA